MVFEQQVPPVPSRVQELKGIKRLQDSWFSQPFYRFYMNEDIRVPKMELANRIKATRRQFISNIFIFGLLFLPLAMLTKRFHLYTSVGVPHYRYHGYYILRRTSLDYRKNLYNRRTLSAWVLATLSASALNTSFELRTDDNYCTYNKVPKMI